MIKDSWSSRHDGVQQEVIKSTLKSPDTETKQHLQRRLLVQLPEKKASQIWSPKLIIWVAHYDEFSYIHNLRVWHNIKKWFIIQYMWTEWTKIVSTTSIIILETHIIFGANWQYYRVTRRKICSVIISIIRYFSLQFAVFPFRNILYSN